MNFISVSSTDNSNDKAETDIAHTPIKDLTISQVIKGARSAYLKYFSKYGNTKTKSSDDNETIKASKYDKFISL